MAASRGVKRNYKLLAKSEVADEQKTAKQAQPKRQKQEQAKPKIQKQGKPVKVVYSLPAILRRHHLPDGSIPLCFNSVTLEKLFRDNVGFQFLRSEPYRRAAQEHLVVAPVYKLSGEGNKCYGVFALAPIKKGTVLGRYRGEEKAIRLGESIEQYNGRPYAFLTPSIVIDAEHKGSYSRFFNHSNNNNCVFVVEKQKEVYVVAKQDIPANAQLTVDYGPYYFEKESQPIFLQPTDSWQSPEALFIENVSSYFIPNARIHPLTRAIEELTGTTEKLLRVPVGIELLDGETLAPLPKQLTSLDLPILECEEKTGKIKDNNQKEITLLMAVCFADDTKAVEVLLASQRVNPNAQSYDGKTPLIYTVLSKTANPEDKVKIIKALLKNKASVYFADRIHKTVFHYCLDAKLYSCFSALFNELDLELFDNRVTSIVSYIIQKRDFKALEIFAKLTTVDKLDEFLFDIDANNKIERLTEQGDLFVKELNLLSNSEFAAAIKTLNLQDKLLEALDDYLHAEVIQKLKNLSKGSPELAPRRMEVDAEKAEEKEEPSLLDSSWARFFPQSPVAAPAAAATKSAAAALVQQMEVEKSTERRKSRVDYRRMAKGE